MTEEEQLRGIDVQILSWLETHGPREWHMLACAYNWDNGIEPLRWIADRNECAAETALRIFILAEPFSAEHISALRSDCEVWREKKNLGVWCDMARYHCQVFKLLEFISERWEGVGYRWMGFQLSVDDENTLRDWIAPALEVQRQKGLPVRIPPGLMDWKAHQNPESFVIAPSLELRKRFPEIYDRTN